MHRGASAASSAMTSGAHLRVLVAEIPRDRATYGAWWDSSAGRTLADWIAGALAPSVARGVRARTGRSVDHGVVLGLVVEALAPPSQLVRGMLAPATADPPAYLARSLTNALTREIGTEPGVDLHAAVWAAHARPEALHVDLASAVRSVRRVLLPVTPPRLRPSFARVVDRVVDRARDGALSRLHTRTALDERLLALGWSREQLRALVNVVVGSRPDHARASLLAGYLTRRDWQPQASPAHRAAIGRYAKRMARWESGSSLGRDAG